MRILRVLRRRTRPLRRSAWRCLRAALGGALVVAGAVLATADLEPPPTLDAELSRLRAEAGFEQVEWRRVAPPAFVDPLVEVAARRVGALVRVRRWIERRSEWTELLCSEARWMVRARLQDALLGGDPVAAARGLIAAELARGVAPRELERALRAVGAEVEPDVVAWLLRGTPCPLETPSFRQDAWDLLARLDATCARRGWTPALEAVARSWELCVWEAARREQVLTRLDMLLVDPAADLDEVGALRAQLDGEDPHRALRLARAQFERLGGEAVGEGLTRGQSLRSVVETLTGISRVYDATPTPTEAAVAAFGQGTGARPRG